MDQYLRLTLNQIVLLNKRTSDNKLVTNLTKRSHEIEKRKKYNNI